MLRLELDTVKYDHLEMEKKYFEEMEIVKGKNDHLQNTIKLSEETLTKTIFQYHRQMDILTAENKRLTSELGSEKQNIERLETEVESYRFELATAIQNFEQSQESERGIQLTFQRAREELFGLRDKLNFDMSNLKHNNEVLSQQLSNAERKFRSLETEFHHARDALREANLLLERVRRELSETQCQKTEIEHMYQSEREKVKTYMAKLECLEERCSFLKSENMLLPQQRDDAGNKSHKEKTVIIIQDLFQDIIKLFQANTEKVTLRLEERNHESICDFIFPRLHLIFFEYFYK
uniref:CCDC144C-like coiled-coil domain-containing protein n=1 Tax=Rhinolophus ferrumequinum TaxID=59479 RepID=A0A671F9C2_RHIFE